MRKRHNGAVRRGVGLGLLALALGLGLSACEGFRAAGYSPMVEEGPWDSKNPTPNERAFARSDFSLEVIHFTDARTPEIFDATADPEHYIYRYDPDQLLRGVTTQVPMLMEMYMGYKPRMPKHYMVELELRELHTDIRTGTFLSGSGGRYTVEMEVVATARRATDSSVALRHFYRLKESEPRGLGQGRGPTVEQDRAAMYTLADGVLRKISARVSRELIGGDARRWDVRKDPAKVVPYNPEIRIQPVKDDMQLPEVPQPIIIHDGAADETPAVAPKKAPEDTAGYISSRMLEERR